MAGTSFHLGTARHLEPALTHGVRVPYWGGGRPPHVGRDTRPPPPRRRWAGHEIPDLRQEGHRLLDPAGNALSALPLAAPLVARRAPIGLLIAGTLRGADDLRLARSLGARVFEETDYRIFEEQDGEARDSHPFAEEPGAAEAFLLTSDGSAWSVEEPVRWPSIEKVLALEAPARPLDPSLAPAPSGKLRLEPTGPGEAGAGSWDDREMAPAWASVSSGSGRKTSRSCGSAMRATAGGGSTPLEDCRRRSRREGPVS